MGYRVRPGTVGAYRPELAGAVKATVFPHLFAAAAGGGGGGADPGSVFLLPMNQSGVFADISTYAHTISPKNFEPSTFLNGQHYFDGGQGLVYTPGEEAPFTSSDWTWECFFTPGESATTGGGVLYGDSDMVYLDFNASNTRQLRAVIWLPGYADLVQPVSSALTVGERYHVALTKLGNRYDIWINGVSTGNATLSGAPASPGNIVIGNTSGGSAGNRSYMSNVRINMTALYTAPFTPPTEPFPVP